MNKNALMRLHAAFRESFHAVDMTYDEVNEEYISYTTHKMWQAFKHGYILGRIK